MPKAILNGTVIAESDHTVMVEGNHYFPPESVRSEYLAHSDHQTVCPWKGTAAYQHVTVDGERRDNAAWTYPDPKPDAAHIKDHVAFYGVVKVMP